MLKCHEFNFKVARLKFEGKKTIIYSKYVQSQRESETDCFLNIKNFQCLKRSRSHRFITITTEIYNRCNNCPQQNVYTRKYNFTLTLPSLSTSTSRSMIIKKNFSLRIKLKRKMRIKLFKDILHSKLLIDQQNISKWNAKHDWRYILFNYY